MSDDYGTEMPEDDSVKIATNNGPIDLNGWDIVNAGTFAAVNQGIEAQKTTPPTFEYTNGPMSVARLTGGKWNTWKLIKGSDGKTISIEMPVTEGTAELVRPPATYEVLDPATKGNVDLSPDGTTLTGVPGASLSQAAFSTTPAPGGKFYFEVRNLEPQGLSGRVAVGLASDTSHKQNYFSSLTSYAFLSDGSLFNGNTADDKFKSDPDAKWATSGDIIGIAVDREAGKVWFRGPPTTSGTGQTTPGKWLGAGANPENGDVPALSGIDPNVDLYIAFAVYSTGKGQVNLDGKAWAYTDVPMGFTPGVIDVDTSSVKVPLANASVRASITLADIPTNGPAVKLMANATETVATPAVTVNSVTLGNGSTADPAIVTAFDAVLNRDLKVFANVFHIVDPSLQAEKTMTWMKPKTTKYAAADLKDDKGDVTNSVLAVLNVTEDNTSKTVPVEQVDPAIVNNLPDDANAVVAISAESLTREILLPGAMNIVADAKITDFEIYNDNRVVRNVVPLSFGKMKMNTKKGDPEITVEPTIPKHGMEMTIDGRTIKTTFKKLSFDYPRVDLDSTEKVTFSFVQTLYLKSNKREKDQHHILMPTKEDPKNPVPGATGLSNFVVETKLIPNKAKESGSLSTALIIGLVAGGVVALIVGGGAVYWVCASGAEEGAADAVGVAAAEGGGAAAAEIPEQIYAGFDAVQMQVYDVVNSADMAGDYVNPWEPLAEEFVFETDDGTALRAKPKARKPLPAGGIPSKIQYAVGFSHLMTMAGASKVSDLGMTEADAKEFAKGDFDKPSIAATVEKFIENALKPFDWPQTKGWEFRGAELNGSLMLYGKIVPK